MEVERWQRLKARFHEASELKGRERDRFLAEVRADDIEAARELEAMFAAETAGLGPLDADAGGRATPQLDGAPLIGRCLGRWELVESIGKGGTSEVFRAQPIDGTGSPVAIKVLHAGLASHEVLRRFALEEETLAALRHPNIVALLGAEVLDDGRPALVMEYIDGAPIDAHCRRAGLDARAVLTLFLEVCGAVRCAHRNLVVHRDLKPQNILVQADGTPKVLDFGVVKLLAPNRSDVTTHPGSIAPLTLRYASPEQSRGGPISTATDVYSLGVVLGELLDACTSTLPKDLSVILDTATQADPELRYVSVEALAEDVERYLASAPIRARRGSRLYRISRFVGRHRASVAVTCTLVLLLLVALGFLHGQWRRAQRAEVVGWRAHGQALQVASFFHRLIDAADPEALAGDPGLVRALDEAAARVGTDLLEYPEAEGRLRYSIARFYLALGRLEEALPHADRALILASNNVGFDENDRRVMRELIQRIEVRSGG